MMEKSETTPGIAMYITEGCLVAPVQVELYDETVMEIQTSILKKIEQSEVSGLILDVSGVDVMDIFAAREITGTCKMASLLGVEAVLAGINPGVASALTDLDFECGDIRTALTIDEGFKILKAMAGADIADEEGVDGEKDETEETGENLIEESKTNPALTDYLQ